MRDGVNIHTQSKREAIVPESEIMHLPDLPMVSGSTILLGFGYHKPPLLQTPLQQTLVQNGRHHLLGFTLSSTHTYTQFFSIPSGLCKLDINGDVIPCHNPHNLWGVPLSSYSALAALGVVACLMKSHKTWAFLRK